MRMASTLKLFLASLLTLVILSFPSAHGLAQGSQTTIAYRYGYVAVGSGFHDLHLINPEFATQAEQVIALPIATDEFVSSITASPDGQWMSFIVTPNDNPEGTQLRLFNLLTGEVRVKLVWDIFNSIAWSPNGRYLASISTDAQTPGTWETYVYDLQTDSLNYISLDGSPYGLSWSPDSTRLAVTAMTQCLQNSCQGQINAVSVPEYVVIASTHFDTSDGLLCDFAWSPDNRYLGFIFSCGDTFLSYYLHDVFIWDTTTQTTQKLTAFTEDLDFASLQSLDPNEQFNTGFDIIWYDPNHLLVGLYTGRFTDGIGYDPATVQVKTNIYHPDGSSTQISSAMFNSWVLNPTNNMIAFRSEEKVLYTDEQNMPQLKDQTVWVQVATLNGDSLQILSTQSDGCNLSWSPDGVYLAYIQRGNDSSICTDPAKSFNFLNPIRRQTSQIPASMDILWSGWIAVAIS